MPGKKVTKPFAACSVILLFLLFSAFTAQAAPQTWTVENGESIQDAIDSASAGDTILVEPGTYVEYLEVNKSLTIEGTGDGVIISPSGGGDIVLISSPDVSLKRLVFQGSNDGNTALDIYGNTPNVQIRNCIFRDVDTGLWIGDESMNLVVANCTFENIRDFGIDSETTMPTDPYFRVLSIGNRFVFDPVANASSTAFHAKYQLGNIALFNTFEDYAGHWAISTPASTDYSLNATDNYWGEDAEDSDIDAACSAKVLYVPWSYADAAGHADYQSVPIGGSAVFDVGASEGITLSLGEITTLPSPRCRLALAAYGDESPCPTTVQDDNPGADSYTAYFTLKDMEPMFLIPSPLPLRMTAEFPKEALGDEADLNDLRIYAYDNGDKAWVEVTNEEGITIEADGDVVRLVVEELVDPGPFAITAGNGDSSSGGCSSTGAASLGLMLLIPFGLLLRSKK